ncbi:MAG: UvrD-helicase domain-containing protein, partial [Pseudomonadota bacterium]|nr:UvrD-helicase domain-containing protein [Pseudomonadota bacterium]
MENDPFDLGSDTPPPPQAQSGSISAAARANMDARRVRPMLDGLNDEQRAAVLAEDGPLLLLAGAGTGKTRALTTRIAHKIATGQAWPSQILAVTFTNKAAREMKERISSLMGETVEGMGWLGTFHSISVRILRRHAELVDLRPDFTILDTDDQIRLIKQIIQAENIDEKRWPARQMAGLIDRWKNRGWSPEDVPDSESGFFANGLGGKIYTQYQQRLKILNATDFGDLLLECLRLFRENDAVLVEYQNKFKHILVDEYQDTNAVQYLWLRLLAQAHNNICCVGDDDQSIYGWRGVEVDNILRFERDFAGAQVIRLERNYRSTPHILAAASGLIAANEGRLGKELWTDLTEGEKVVVRGAWDGDEEARLTGDDIEAYQRAGDALNEIAILVRASFQMREFEDRFIALGVPYRVIGGPRFYERAEIRDANAYFRLIAQADDDLAFERI